MIATVLAWVAVVVFVVLFAILLGILPSLPILFELRDMRREEKRKRARLGRRPDSAARAPERSEP